MTSSRPPQSLSPLTFAGDSINYLAPDWDQMQELAFAISKKIIADGHRFDRIITLAKGGWPMTRSLVDFLEVDEVASIGVKFYGGINQRLDQPVIYQDLPISVTGEKILLFDDVADSGQSLEFAVKYLHDRKVDQITLATLFYKPHSCLKPDYYGAQTSSWIIFPYDAVDTIKVLGAKWRQAGIKEVEIKDRFSKLNFRKALVEYYG